MGHSSSRHLRRSHILTAVVVVLLGSISLQHPKNLFCRFERKKMSPTYAIRFSSDLSATDGDRAKLACHGQMAWERFVPTNVAFFDTQHSLWFMAEKDLFGCSFIYFIFSTDCCSTRKTREGEVGLCLDHHHRLKSMARASVGGNSRRILPPLHHDVMRILQTVCRRRCRGGSFGGSSPRNESSSTRMEQQRRPHPFSPPRFLVPPSGHPSRAPPNGSRRWNPFFHSGLFRGTTTTTPHTRIQWCASFSTVAEATTIPEPEQDENDDDRDDDDQHWMIATDNDNDHAREKTEERSRPRLRALRHLLQTEAARPPPTVPPKNTTSRSPPLVTQSTSPPSTLHLTKPTQEATKSSSPRNPKTLEELRHWIQQLPDISLPSNNNTTKDDDPDSSSSMVLTDRFHRRHSYLRLSLTERCNLRCTYCMPEHGVPLQPPQHLLQTPELVHLAGTFAHHGVTKFRLTGGEPTLRRDVVDIVHGLAALHNKNKMKRHIGMTTNGIVLASQLPALMEAGLTHVNVSLDTLQADKFATLTRRPGTYLTKVWESLEACHDLLSHRPGHGFKLNCVVMRHVNTNEIADFVRLTQTTFPQASIRFIEYMPFTQNGWNTTKLVPYQELLTTLAHDHGINLTPVPSDDASDTTKWYTTPWDTTSTTTSTTAGRIGFITSMTDHFCGSCNRLRLTADGTLKVCLFDGTTEFSLRDALRAGCTEYELSKVVHAALQQKQWKLGGHASPISVAAHADSNQPMTLIGG